MEVTVKNLMTTYSNSMTEFHCKPSLFSSLLPVVVIKGFSFSLKKKQIQIHVLVISFTAQDWPFCCQITANWYNLQRQWKCINTCRLVKNPPNPEQICPAPRNRNACMNCSIWHLSINFKYIYYWAFVEHLILFVPQWHTGTYIHCERGNNPF